MSVHPHMSEVPTKLANNPDLRASELAVQPNDAVDLFALHDRDVERKSRSRREEYELLVPTYRQALAFARDPDSFAAFREHARWAERQRKPRVDAHATNAAMLWAMMAVFGGDRERDKRASFLARACSYLAREKVPPERLIDEIERSRGPSGKSGLVALAKREAEERAKASGKATKPKPLHETIKVRVVTEVRPRLPKGVFIVRSDDGELLVSSAPDDIKPIRVA